MGDEAIEAHLLEGAQGAQHGRHRLVPKLREQHLVAVVLGFVEHELAPAGDRHLAGLELVALRREQRGQIDAQTIGKLAEAIIGQRHAAALDLGNRGDCQPGALGDLGQRQALLEPYLAQPFAHADPAVLPIRYGVDALVHARV